MQKEMDTPERGVKIIELDGAYQMCTKPEMYEALIKVAKQPKKTGFNGCFNGNLIYYCLQTAYNKV